VARQVEHGVAQGRERVRLGRLVGELDVERRPPYLLQQLAMDLDELTVVVGLEQLRRQVVGARQAAAAVRRLDDELLLGRLDQIGLERLLGRVGGLDQLLDPRQRRRPCVEDL